MGLRPCARRHQTGKRPKLTPEQQQRLLALLQEGAGTQGAVGERWTGKRVAALIKRECGVVYHPEYIPRRLRGLGWTAQQPLKQATPRDEVQIAAFKDEWAAIKKGRSRKAGRSSG